MINNSLMYATFLACIFSTLQAQDILPPDEALEFFFNACKNSKDTLIEARKEYRGKRNFNEYQAAFNEYLAAYYDFSRTSLAYVEVSNQFLDTLRASPQKRMAWKREIRSFDRKCKLTRAMYRPIHH